MSDSLHVKYRPQTLAEVIGQDAVVNALSGVIERQAAHTFLFLGPSGVGKTTLARIAASEVGCAPNDITEVDAATYTGADDMRQLTDGLRYRPIGGVSRALIIDEVHRISAAAWASLLKSTEEPPPWAYWFFCTTVPGKVPANIKTRCVTFDLKPLPWQLILRDLLVPIAEIEGIKVGEPILGLCAREAQGSPRQALVNLAVCASTTDPAEAAGLLRSAEAGTEAVDLARALVKGVPWAELVKLITALQDTDAEGVRQVVRAYVTTVTLGAKSDKVAQRAMAILDCFSQPFYHGDGITPVLLAAGRLVFAMR